MNVPSVDNALDHACSTIYNLGESPQLCWFENIAPVYRQEAALQEWADFSARVEDARFGVTI